MTKVKSVAVQWKFPPGQKLWTLLRSYNHDGCTSMKARVCNNRGALTMIAIELEYQLYNIPNWECNIALSRKTKDPRYCMSRRSRGEDVLVD